jgi:rubredoxin
MKKYKCVSCGFIYDPNHGHSDGGLKSETSFIDIPEDWVCPVCSAGKGHLSPLEEVEIKTNVIETLNTGERHRANTDAIKELRNINQQMADSKYSVYKKSTYWHQQTSGTPDSNMIDMLIQVSERLGKIEAKLDSIENTLKQ